jgi:hypothetical protein
VGLRDLVIVPDKGLAQLRICIHSRYTNLFRSVGYMSRSKFIQLDSYLEPGCRLEVKVNTDLYANFVIFVFLYFSLDCHCLTSFIVLLPYVFVPLIIRVSYKPVPVRYWYGKIFRTDSGSCMQRYRGTIPGTATYLFVNSILGSVVVSGLPGSAFIWLSWIRSLIRIGFADPDPGA